MFKLKHAIIVSLLMTVLTGCVAHNANIKSYAAPDLPEFSFTQAAQETAAVLVQVYPPAFTTIILSDGDAELNQLIENELRAQGFNIGGQQDKDNGAIELKYRIDRLFEERACYLNISLSDGFTYSRAYSVKAGTVNPISTVQGRK